MRKMIHISTLRKQKLGEYIKLWYTIDTELLSTTSLEKQALIFH